MRRASALVCTGLVLLLASAAGSADRRTAVVRAVERIGPAVVNISTAQVSELKTAPFPLFRDPLFDQFFRDFFEPRRQRVTRTSLGSGVITRPEGYVLTNQHVILRGTRIRVTLADEREFDARLVGADSDSDLAVLKMESDTALPVAELGDSDGLLIGETAIAIGNPFGLSHTVTTGVISATGRSVKTKQQTFYDFIQTDAAINPGNSGGPLLDIDGKLIGINTAIYQGAQGIGFAIPINRAQRVMDDLIVYGEVQSPWIGALVQAMNPELASHFGLASKGGVLIRGVEDDSPAAAARLKRGDVILALDGRPVRSTREYRQRLRGYPPASTIRFTLWRHGRKLTARVRPGVFPPERADALAWELLGLRLAAAGKGLRVAAVRRGSPAARIGITRGDVVVGLAGVPLDSINRFRKKMAEVRHGRSVLLSVRRGNRVYRITLPLSG